jgi:uncharacterized membrane protein YebE (DUF533 family)
MMESYFNVLVCVARADGTVSADERERVLATAAAYGLSEAAQQRLGALLVAPSCDTQLIVRHAASSLDGPALAELMRDAYVLVRLGSDTHVAEVGVLEQLLEARGYPPERRAVIHTWARQAAQHQLDGIALLVDS